MSTGLTTDEDTLEGRSWDGVQQSPSRNWDNFDQDLIDPETGEPISRLTAVPSKGGLPTTALTASTQTQAPKENPYQLAPDMVDRFNQWKQAVHDQMGMDVAVTEGYRDPARSDALHKSGIIAAPGGYSYHNFGEAFDYGFQKPGGGVDLYNEKAYAQAEKLAHQFGLTGISKESGHIQNASYPTINDLRKAYPNGYTPGTQPTQPPTTQQPAVQQQPQVQQSPIRSQVYGPKFNEPKQTVGAFNDNKLQPGDYAVSNDLAAGHQPFETFQFQDGQGNWHTGRYADKSYLDPGHPNTNTIEAWNGEDFGGTVNNLQWTGSQHQPNQQPQPVAPKPPVQQQPVQPVQQPPVEQPPVQPTQQQPIPLEPITVTGQTPQSQVPQLQQQPQQNYYPYGQPSVNYMGPGTQPSTQQPAPFQPGQQQVRRAQLVEPNQMTVPRAQLVEPDQTSVPRAQLVQQPTPNYQQPENYSQYGQPGVNQMGPVSQRPQTQTQALQSAIQTPAPSTWQSVQNPAAWASPVQTPLGNLFGGIGNLFGGIGNAIGNAWENLWNIF